MFRKFVLPVLGAMSIAVAAPALATGGAKDASNHDVPECCRQMAMHMQLQAKEDAAKSQDSAPSSQRDQPSQASAVENDPSGWGG